MVEGLLALDLAVVKGVVGWRRAHPSVARVLDSVLSPNPFCDIGVLVLVVFVRAVLAERGFPFFWTCAASVGACWALQDALGARLPFDVEPSLKPFVLTGARYRGFPAMAPVLAVVVCGTLAIDDISTADARRRHAAAGGAPGAPHMQGKDGWLLPPAVAGGLLLALAALVGVSRVYSGSLFVYQLLLSWALGGAALWAGDAAAGWVPGMLLEQQLRAARAGAVAVGELGVGGALSSAARREAATAAGKTVATLNFGACFVLGVVALGVAALRCENNDSSCVGVRREEFTRVFADIYSSPGTNNSSSGMSSAATAAASSSLSESGFSELSGSDQGSYSEGESAAGDGGGGGMAGAGLAAAMLSPAARRLRQRQRQKKDSLYRMMKGMERRSMSIKHGIAMAQTSDASDAEGGATADLGNLRRL